MPQTQMKIEPDTPLLFLDVDGVLNTRPGSLDRDKLDLVEAVRDLTGCAIVLSSSWRLIPRQLARICAELPILGVTPEIGAWERGKEVQAFLDANPGHRRFVILDDSASIFEPFMRPHLLLCDGWEGLTPTIAGLAAVRLKGGGS